MTLLLMALYLAAITAANLIVVELGPEASVYTAFGLVAFDLVARDLLHERWAGLRRWVYLGALIAAGSLISYAVNSDAEQIAKASAIAFASAFTVDALIYQVLLRRPWLERSNGSNLIAAAVDSVVFVAIAFPGPMLWDIAFGQFTAKVAGGALISIVALHTWRRATA